MPYEADSGDFEIALGGDSILTRRLQVFREDRFLGLRDLWRSSDAGFINLESGVVHRYLEGHHNVGGMYMTTEPHLLEDLRWLGVNMVSSAARTPSTMARRAFSQPWGTSTKRRSRTPGPGDTSGKRGAQRTSTHPAGEWPSSRVQPTSGRGQSRATSGRTPTAARATAPSGGARSTRCPKTSWRWPGSLAALSERAATTTA